MQVPVGVQTAKVFCGLFVIVAVLMTTRYDVLGWLSFTEETPVAEAPGTPVVRNFREGRPAEDEGGGLQAYMPGAQKDEVARPRPKLGKAAPLPPRPTEPAHEPEYDALAVLLRAIGAAD